MFMNYDDIIIVQLNTIIGIADSKNGPIMQSYLIHVWTFLVDEMTQVYVQ